MERQRPNLAAASMPEFPIAAASRALLTNPKAFATLQRQRSRSRSASPSPSSVSPKASPPRGAPPAWNALLKKGKAGGGKGSWGRFDDDIWAALELAADAGALHDDDDDCDSGIIMVESRWDISTEEMQTFLRPKLKQYFTSHEAMDAEDPVVELARPELNAELVEFLVTEAVVANDVERELVSTLLTRLAARMVFTSKEIEAGFELVLRRLNDLSLDTPNVDVVVGKFMARAVADDVVAPSFLTGRCADADSNLATRAFVKARCLVAGFRGLARLEHVWGTHGGRSPVATLKAKVRQLLEEYVASRDLSEAERCVCDLRAPQFHHEVVFQAVVKAVDGRCSEEVVALSQLIRSLCSTAVVSATQLSKGLDRVLAVLSDMQVDVPRAATNLDAFCRVSSSFVPRGYAIFVSQIALTASASKADASKPKIMRIQSVNFPIVSLPPRTNPFSRTPSKTA